MCIETAAMSAPAAMALTGIFSPKYRWVPCASSTRHFIPWRCASATMPRRSEQMP
ncbi:hypothetical protein EVA_16320 [gut metagenome]|uniref:Uncharacterized protein n=1 Tax=gut metagenome TaxID=749906 RepID=J9G7Z4_9ZZZZ